MPVTRVMPTQEAANLLKEVRELAQRELAPIAAEHEETHTFPREVFRTLGRAGLLGMPYPKEFGGGGWPMEVYVQVLEELGSVWASVAVGTSVHTLSCFGLVNFGTREQQERWLPDMLGGELLGAYCLSEPHAGSDPSAMSTRAVRDGDSYVLTGTKAWVTHGGEADFYKVMARTSEDRGGISCFLVPADAEGVVPAKPERKMGLMGSTTSVVALDGVVVPAERRLGGEGDGLKIALAGLDSGRLGIAACAVGVSQAALEVASDFALRTRLIEEQGIAFKLAEMAAAVETARAMVHAASRRKDLGMSISREASIAKMVATDNAMRVTTDAVQVLGDAGYTQDYPVERYLREVKVMQIFEGTNQIQRIVISRALGKDAGEITCRA